MKTNCLCRSGRTRADLVAVLVLLVVLGVLLVPPLVARTQRQPQCMCLANLKRLEAAVTLYMYDYDATFPSSVLYGGSKTWNPGNFAAFASLRGELPAPQSTPWRTWRMLLDPYVRDPRAFWCPSDQSVSDDPSAVVSYYWKAAVDYAWYAGVARKEGDYRFPSNQMVLYERCGWHSGGRQRGLTDGVTINCAFLDGHVGAMEIANSGYSRREVPAGPLPASGVGEPAWYNYSFGVETPAYSTGQNWDPMIWGDNLTEIATRCEDPAESCQDNLRRIAFAVQFYAGDWDATLPNSRLYGGSETWNPDDFVRFAAERGDLRRGLAAAPASWPELLYGYGVWERGLWCPSDRSRSDSPDATVSYYWKAAVDAACYGGPGVSGRRNDKIEYFQFPESQMVVYERLGWHSQGRGRGLSDGVYINCAFLDGHVDGIVIRNSGYTPNETQPGPLPASGVGEPAWFNYSYGDPAPWFSTDANWDPAIWGDRFEFGGGIVIPWPVP